MDVSKIYVRMYSKQSKAFDVGVGLRQKNGLSPPSFITCRISKNEIPKFPKKEGKEKAIERLLPAFLKVG